MGARGPLPNPNSEATRRGINSLSTQNDISDPGDWDVETELAEHGDWLGQHGKSMWRDVAPVLKQAEILTKLDLIAFSLMCHFWDTYQTADEQLRKTGSTYTTPRGRTETHPLVKIKKANADSFLGLAAQFGMTPASRKRNGWVIGADDEELDPFEEYMRNR